MLCQMIQYMRKKSDYALSIDVIVLIDSSNNIILNHIHKGENTMDRYIYYCPNCHYLGSAEHKTPNEYQGCSECKSAMVYAGYTKAEWDTKSKEEKEQIKAQLKDKYPASASTSVNLPSPDVLSKINDNINTIKNILMFYLILSIVGIFFMIINFLV